MAAKPLILAACLAAAAAPALAAGNMEPDRVERWEALAGMIFGDDARIDPTETVTSTPQRAPTTRRWCRSASPPTPPPA